MTRRLFGTLCGLVFLINFGRVVFAPLLEPLMAAFSVGEGTMGAIVSVAWLGTALPRIPMGYVLTRVPRHQVVLATGGLLTLAAAFTAAATSVRMLAVGAFLLGVASGAYFVSAVPLVSRLYPSAIGRSVGIHGTASQLAAVAAPAVVTGVILVASWREVFVLLALSAFVISIALALAFRGAEMMNRDSSQHAFLGAMRAHWRMILTGVLMVSIAGFVWQGLFNFYVTYMTRDKGLPLSTAQTLLSVVFAAGVPAFWYSGRLADRLPHVPYILAILTGFTGCVLALTTVHSVALLFVVTAALGYAIHSLFPALDTYMLDSLPDETSASAYAVFTGLSLLIEANGTGIVGMLTGAGYAFDAVFRLLALALGIVLVVLAGFYRAGWLPETG